MKIYSVQPYNVVQQLQDGTYMPKLSLSFAREHEFFKRAYEDMKDLYFLKTNVLMFEEETGLWGYEDLESIDQTKLRPFERVCTFEVDEPYVLKINYQIWESILDGESSVCESSEELLNVSSGLQQLYFSSAAVKKVGVLKFA